MKSSIFSTLLLAGTLGSPLAFAGSDEAGDHDHYEGKEAKTLEQAVSLFSEYNAKVAAILEKGEPSYKDMHKIHELTYTIENALAKINGDMNELADQLERLHKASEHGKAKDSLAEGKKYLEAATTVIK